MSDLPVSADYFVGGQRISPVDRSEGGAPLASLLNAAGQSAEVASALAASTDLSAATAAAVKTANRGLSTNAGAARTYTLPVFADAEDGWEHTFLALTTHNFVVAAAGADTINGIAGDITLATAMQWAKVMKVPGATGWLAVGGDGHLPA